MIIERKKEKSERGFMLLQAITAIAISSVVSIGLMQRNIDDQSVLQAEIAGKLIHQYTAAVAEYTSANNVTIITGLHPVGVAWLRTAASCGAGNGTGLKDYLPCSFPSSFPFVLSPDTLFTTLGGGKWAVTSTFGRILNGTNIRMDLSETAKKAAMGLGNEQSTPQTSTTFNEYKVSYVPGITEGTLSSVVSTNTSTDSWIRTDGSNQMNANLNLGANDIVNAKNGLFSGSVSAGLDVNVGQSLGVGVPATGLAGRIDANGVINTNQFVEATGHPGSGKLRFGGSVYSGVPMVTNVGNDLNIASVGLGTTRIGWYHPTALAINTGAYSKAQYGNGWALASYNSAGGVTGAASSPRSATSSLYVNDILLRSKNIWLSDVVNRLATTPIMATQLVNANGSIVAKPVCVAGGVPKIYVIPLRWTQGGASYRIFWYAINNGASWSVSAKHIRASAGVATIPTLVPNATAIVQIACRY